MNEQDLTPPNPIVVSDYSANNIQVLEGIEHVRKRPAMYIGDVGMRGLHHLVYEVVDNSIDEAMAGYASDITVTIHSDNSVSVRDNGRGIPVGIHDKEGISALELVMTRLGAGGKFDKNTYKVSGGLHGVGVSCVNALSVRCDVWVHREGKVHYQQYRCGVAQEPVKVIGDSTYRGTETRFWPDGSIFTETVYRFDTLQSRLRELAFLNRGVRITLTDERPSNEDSGSELLTAGPQTKVFHSEGGLVEFIKFLDNRREPLHPDPIYISGIDDANTVPVELAFQYNSSYSENVFSYVNNINTHEGGTHVTGFRTALTRALKNYAEESGALKKVKFAISGDDFREGLTCIISVKVPEPQFEGQTKTKLGNSDVQGIVNSIVYKGLTNYLEENPNIAKLITQKVIIAAEARNAAKKAREAVQKRSGFGGGLPGKLANCASRKPEECEVFLVEGDSAGGTAKQARDRRTQAILPLRGKILNVEKSHPSRIFDSEEIKNIVTALGVTGIGTGEPINIEKLRYHKVVIMTDADVDGSHIRTLLLTLFYRHLTPLIEGGHIYIAAPPLYQVRVGKKSRYCWTEEERKIIIQELADGDESRATIQRYKGLGEMNAEQLWETTMDVERRSLYQVTVENAVEADIMFSTLMGDEVPPRREFIELNARYANIDL